MNKVPQISTNEAKASDLDDSLLFLDLMVIRHGSDLLPVFFQCVLLLGSVALICGVVYYMTFIAILVFHHWLLDRKVDLLPQFVHVDQLPCSDEESFDDEEKEALEYYGEIIRRRNLKEQRSLSQFSEPDDADADSF